MYWKGLLTLYDIITGITTIHMYPICAGCITTVVLYYVPGIKRKKTFPIAQSIIMVITNYDNFVIVKII